MFSRLYKSEKKCIKICAPRYRCKIRRGIQIQAQNLVTMQRKAEKYRKLSENHKIASIKKRCGKLPSAPITIRKNIKKGKFWRLVYVPKPASVTVITSFLCSGFQNFPPFLVRIGANDIDYIFLGIFWRPQASERRNSKFSSVKHFFRVELFKQPSRGEKGV